MAIKEIDRIRDGAFSLTVGDDTSGEMAGIVSVEGLGAYVVREYAIFKLQLADEVDPERKNREIPNGTRKILSAGSNSTAVARVFLSADALFNRTYFDSNVGPAEVLHLSLEITEQLVAAEELILELRANLENALGENRQPSRTSFCMPTIPLLNSKVETFVQKVEHSAQVLYRLTRLFYGHDRRFFEGFRDEIERVYGVDDEFSQFAAKLAVFMKFVRNLRHCIEHKHDEQKLLITDFYMQDDGSIARPTIEVIHKETPENPIDVVGFVEQVFESVTVSVESLFVHLAAKNLNSAVRFPIAVGIIPKEVLSNNNSVRVGYMVAVDGVFRPLS